MRALRIAFLTFFFAFTLLPMTTDVLGLFPAQPLFGVVAPVSEVPLSWKAYWKGEFQPPFESTFDAGLEMRGHAVRLDNELNFRVFRQLGYNPHTSIVLGKDDYIFDRSYVDSFNRHDEIPAAQIEARVQRALLLQEHMQARGGTFLLLISPSKAELYPEYLPDNMIDGARQRVPRNYDKLKPLLDRYGIQYFDAFAYLSDLKGSVPFTWFQNSGIHWNDPAACEVTARVLEQLQAQLNRPISQLACKPYTISHRPRPEDSDVLRVCNLLLPDRLERPAYYARPRVTPRAPSPSILIVGGSFNRAFMRYLDRARIHDNYLFYYYSKLERHRKSRPLQREMLDFEQDVFKYDVVIIEVNVETIDELGFGFLEDAERAIRKGQGAN
ncbi:MAG: alginate O-acetyltransferase AlgX-related protein [Myxococcota bacterium]